ncbi:uncharacterized protein SPSK_04175 [Sporothrix schenckii 1099-18]|uniref:GDS1 winged helix domain-containing protein n=2 Tax=Sporothrix schenckii TaxID=29908 RepID=U7PVV8_SPOS1|nr:uncharacterized protein SPSK_04175 [Sporothrix schenckii 1099-18]ERS99056.1 hypothetical protein HMPREF1624_04251 [Sporothrix schenckii ATCC 58251]KJR83290.1 hypothetical protein SPSK_04175 [Sporothrix schenckii 1099-18]
MPYNTRRKSLSLPSLGIHVPVTHAARAAAAAAAAAATKPTSSNTIASPGASPATSTTSPSNTTSSQSVSSSSSTQRQLTPVFDSTTNMAPPATTLSSSASPKRTSSAVASDAQRPSAKRTKRSHDASPKTAAVATPPQSPKRHQSVERDSSDVEEVEIDMDEVNDDIVEAVIILLKSTGNRPHLIKELSAILMQQLKSVQQSANPCAIISSRLASYMKRPCWSASKNCPLTKELENIHPRRTYYYLTTCPHLPLPDASSVHFIVPRTSIVTPPMSSAASGSETTEEERRRELSPSPEVDLSSPEFDDLDDDIPMPGTPITHLSHRYPRYSREARYHHAGHHRSASSYSSRNHRGASPPLEKDEKEFTQTAEGLQKQKHAGSRFLLSPAAIAAQAAPPSSATAHVHNNGMFLDDAGRDEALLFGSETAAARHMESFALMTSPAMRPMFSLGPKRDHEAENWAKLDSMVTGWDRCPENIELDELDCLLDEF